MLDKITEKNHKVMNLSGDIEELRINYKDLILAGLFGIDKEPDKLIEALDAYRKIH